MTNILLVSQNETFANDLKDQIHLYATDMEVFLDYNNDVIYDIFIFDDNYEEAKIIHEKQAKVPVFLLTSKNENYEDDFAISIVTKPITLNTFLEQLKSCINIYENSEDGFLYFNQYILRPVSKDIVNERNDQEIKLTEKEVAIIKYLYKASNRVVSKNELLMDVWGYNPDVTTHTIETHIYRLRQKIEQGDSDAQIILTSEGGYQLILD